VALAPLSGTEFAAAVYASADLPTNQPPTLPNPPTHHPAPCVTPQAEPRKEGWIVDARECDAAASVGGIENWPQVLHC
jgi:hypothetical protein